MGLLIRRIVPSLQVLVQVLETDEHLIAHDLSEEVEARRMLNDAVKFSLRELAYVTMEDEVTVPGGKRLEELWVLREPGFATSSRRVDALQPRRRGKVP